MAAKEIWRSASTFLVLGTSGGWRSFGRRPSGEIPELHQEAASASDAPLESFDDLYERHHVGAYRFALGLCAGERALAEDAVSEAFAQVYPKWVAGRVDDFGAYLRRAVANQVKAVFRHRGVERRQEQRAGAFDRGVLPFDDRVSQRDLVLRALAALPVKQRTAVVLHYYEDRSLEEVATIMETKLGTAKAHLSRGRDRLRQLIEVEA